jgi:plasmid stability protein
MVAVTVRDVPDDVRNELAARAARRGQSLQEYLLAELRDIAARPSAIDVVSAARARLAAVGGQVRASDIVRAVKADRR